MANAALRCRCRKLRRRAAVDAVVTLRRNAAGMSDAGEMHDLIDIAEIRRPVEGLREIRMLHHFDAGRKVCVRRPPHGGAHRAARSREGRHHCAADEARGAGDQNARHVFHSSMQWGQPRRHPFERGIGLQVAAIRLYREAIVDDFVAVEEQGITAHPALIAKAHAGEPSPALD